MGELAAFLGIAILVIVTPGQDTALTIRNTMLGGRPAGVATADGSRRRPGVLDCGGEHRTGRATRRLGAGLRRAQVAGAAYLVYLGLQALRHAIRPGTRTVERAARPQLAAPPRVPAGPAQQPRQSEDGDLLHELAAAVRELIRAPARTWASLCLLTLAWLSAYSFAVARAGDLLRRPRIRRSLDAFTGTCLVAFGIRLAAER